MATRFPRLERQLGSARSWRLSSNCEHFWHSDEKNIPRSAYDGSGGEIGHQLYYEFGTGKLDGVDFQGVPADEVQHASYGLWRLDGAWTTHEYTQAKGHDTNQQNDDGELYRRKHEFLLFLPDVDDRSDTADQ